MKSKIGLGVSVFTLLLINAITVFAQGGGGNDTGPDCTGAGGDPDGGCPLDTWVILLAFAALIFTISHLYRCKKIAERAI